MTCTHGNLRSHCFRPFLMTERGSTGSKSTGRTFGKASARSKGTIADSGFEEPTALSPKRRKAESVVEKDRNIVGNYRNRDVHEGVATVQRCVKEVAGQVGPRNDFTPSREPRLAQVLAALPTSTAGGDQADLVQPIIQGITQITMFGGTGGNGGNGLGRGIGGGGGVGEGPRLNENFFGTQNVILYSDVSGQVNPGIGRIIEGLANIGDGIVEVGGQFRSFMNDSLRGLVTQLMARWVPRGVSDDLLHIVDPVGGSITVSLRYCHDYATLDGILKGYLRRQPQAGGRYVERGDYSIVSQDGSFIVPVEFAQTVRAGMLLEMSIIQKRIQYQIDIIQKTTCPQCRCPQATTTGNGWFTCGNTTCGSNYRIDGQGQDSEEIWSPQLAEPNEKAEKKLFRRVHIRTVNLPGPPVSFFSPADVSTVPDSSASFFPQGSPVSFFTPADVSTVPDSSASFFPQGGCRWRQVRNLYLRCGHAESLPPIEV
ncbi:hypothetical protein B0H14DRAFT_2559714 [Mycena olivaceomarginata]|nr:hypothetical protein B0H14DRAFT_2559714 [Mycena olivaceomarginata]